MSEITLLNEKFENKGKIPAVLNLSAESINQSAVLLVVKAQLAKRRQGTAATKTKAMVSGGGKKPFKQKGTGNARQGSTRSPLCVGGGTVFGPQPRNYEQKINKKLVNVAIASLLADKFQAGKLHIVEKLQSSGKTKELNSLLASKNLTSSLLVVSSKESATLRAARNLKSVKAIEVSNVNVYDLLKYENLVMEQTSYSALTNRLV